MAKLTFVTGQVCIEHPELLTLFVNVADDALNLIGQVAKLLRLF